VGIILVSVVTTNPFAPCKYKTYGMVLFYTLVPPSIWREDIFADPSPPPTATVRVTRGQGPIRADIGDPPSVRCQSGTLSWRLWPSVVSRRLLRCRHSHQLASAASMHVDLPGAPRASPPPSPPPREVSIDTTTSPVPRREIVQERCCSSSSSSPRLLPVTNSVR
jgi:hypothetical protein